MLTQAGLTVQVIELTDVSSPESVSERADFLFLEEVFESGDSPTDIMISKSLNQISTSEAIDPLVEAVVQENPSPVQDYLGGKAGALRFLVGKVMKKSRGKANPAMVNEALIEKLRTFGADAS